MNLVEAMPMIEALLSIVRTRDYKVEHGHYPLDCGMTREQGFDDWAASLALDALDQYRVFLPPPTTKE